MRLIKRKDEGQRLGKLVEIKRKFILFVDKVLLVAMVKPEIKGRFLLWVAL